MATLAVPVVLFINDNISNVMLGGLPDAGNP
jgi:hypothetical protein